MRYGQASESITRSSHPWQAGGVVELESAVLTQGIYPPTNSAVPHPQDTLELNLARYRIRWRVTNPGIGNPALYLVYWGRDDRITARAPPNWDREVIRRYPLPTVNEALQYPLKLFPQNPAVLMALSNKNRQTPQGLPLPSSIQSHHAGSGTQQLPVPANLRASVPPQSGPPQRSQGNPQQQQHGQAHAQAQAKMQTQAQAQFSQGQVQATGQTPVPTHAQAMHLRTLASHFNFPSPFNDSFDLLSDRSWAGLRYERNHALIAPIFESVRWYDSSIEKEIKILTN